MLVALKQFTMAGLYYGPATDPTPIKASLAAAEQARASVLAKTWMPGEEAEREALLADADDRLGRAQHALSIAKLKRSTQITPEAWAAQRPRVRATLLRGRYVLQVPDGMKVPRKGSRARRAEVLAAAS